jgi:hypothetical protein
METTEIINEINNLPEYKRILIVEQIIRYIQPDNQKAILENAAEVLYDDYKNDEGLTEFTQLDCENFYNIKKNEIMDEKIEKKILKLIKDLQKRVDNIENEIEEIRDELSFGDYDVEAVREKSKNAFARIQETAERLQNKK